LPVIITAEMVATKLDSASTKYPPAQFTMN
jgi:hypothetical protein